MSITPNTPTPRATRTPRTQANANRKSQNLERTNILAKWYQKYLNLPYKFCLSMAMQQVRRSKDENGGEQGNEYQLAYITYNAKKYEGQAITRLCHIKGSTQNHLLVYDIDREADRNPRLDSITKIALVKLKFMSMLTRQNDYIETLVFGPAYPEYCQTTQDNIDYPQGF